MWMLLTLATSLVFIACVQRADALVSCAEGSSSCVGDICYSNLNLQQDTIVTQGCYNGSVYLPYAGRCLGTSMDQICFCNDVDMCNKMNFSDFSFSMETPMYCDVSYTDDTGATALRNDSCPGGCSVNYYTGGSYGCSGLPDFDMYTGFLNNSCIGIFYSEDGKQINCECHSTNNCGQQIVMASNTISSAVACYYGRGMLAEAAQNCSGDFCFIREDAAFPHNTVRGCFYEDRSTFNAFLKPGTFSSNEYRTTICASAFCNVGWDTAVAAVVDPATSGSSTTPGWATGQGPAGSGPDTQAQMMAKQIMETLKQYAYMIKQQMEAVCAKIQSFFGF